MTKGDIFMKFMTAKWYHTFFLFFSVEIEYLDQCLALNYFSLGNCHINHKCN